MIEFINFARNHGLILNSVIYDKWVTTPTEDHPHSSNGRYKLLGDVGWVMNWATMEKPITWFADGKNGTVNIRQQVQASNDAKNLAAKNAQEKAKDILSKCFLNEHQYLIQKGFPLEQGNIFVKDNREFLVIPMRINETLVGCQMIDIEGGKKFLYGQTSKGATFIIGSGGTQIFCEGYATGLSIRNIMKQMNLPFCIHICFSANNMEFVSRDFNEGLVIADNDKSKVGENTAIKIGFPYWISDSLGEDFNDYHLRVGTFRATQSLKKLLLSLKTSLRSA